MKLGYITFMVRDIEKSIEFYQSLAELKVLRRFNPGMGEIAFMAETDGDVCLEFVQIDSAPKVAASGMTLSFKAAGELEDIRAKAAALGYAPAEIINAPPKPAHFTVRDFDGIEVEFSL